MSDYANALSDILEAIERVRRVIGETPFELYAGDYRLRWLCERGRRIPDDVKAAHPDMPWKQIANMGDFLRHEYHKIDDVRVWSTARFELIALEAFCRSELEKIARDQS